MKWLDAEEQVAKSSANVLTVIVYNKCVRAKQRKKSFEKGQKNTY